VAARIASCRLNTHDSFRHVRENRREAPGIVGSLRFVLPRDQSAVTDDQTDDLSFGGGRSWSKALAHDRAGRLAALFTFAPDVGSTDGVVTLSGTADRRSTHELAVRLTARSPGVLKIVDNMTHEIDDQPPKVPAATEVFAPSEA